VQNDLGELYLPTTMKTEFPNPDDILNFILHIEPDEGMYKGGHFSFTFAINQNFPHDPPKVKCQQKIYHPNIDMEGNVCLNILRAEWKPVLNLNAVIVGLQVCLYVLYGFQLLMTVYLKSNRQTFIRNVKSAMGGGFVKGETFDRVIP
jgi:ubiquitin-conjugating enzyme E2 M